MQQIKFQIHSLIDQKLNIGIKLGALFNEIDL